MVSWAGQSSKEHSIFCYLCDIRLYCKNLNLCIRVPDIYFEDFYSFNLEFGTSSSQILYVKALVPERLECLGDRIWLQNEGLILGDIYELISKGVWVSYELLHNKVPYNLVN